MQRADWLVSLEEEEGFVSGRHEREKEVEASRAP